MIVIVWSRKFDVKLNVKKYVMKWLIELVMLSLI